MVRRGLAETKGENVPHMPTESVCVRESENMSAGLCSVTAGREDHAGCSVGRGSGVRIVPIPSYRYDDEGTIELNPFLQYNE